MTGQSDNLAPVDNSSCTKPPTRVWFRGVRSSKFRHVYGEPAKREKCYDNINITKNAHDSQFCAVNAKFLAVVTEVAGGGAFTVVPLGCTGRLDFNASKVTGHSGPVLDIKWNPFNDSIIASCSDDCTVKIWHIPDGGLSTHLTDWTVELLGHKRRVAYIEWHPTVENILFSAGFDHQVIVWNVETGEAVNVIDCHPDVIYSMSLNRDGSLLATTCKDKQLRLIDPRSGRVIAQGICHTGSKASKVTFVGDDLVLTTGFSRHSDRQFALWHVRSDLAQALQTDTVDSSSGVVFPYYDWDTHVVYLAGKGDGNIRYYEVTDQPPHLHFLNQFVSGNPQRGLGILPKRALDTSRHEIFRFYKLHATKGVCEPISMVVPRKSDLFQDDLYPDTAAARPALSAQEWMRGGKSAMPVLVSMRTGMTSTGVKANMNHLHDIPQNKRASSMLSTLSLVSPPPTILSQTNKMKFAFLSTETIPDYRPVNSRQQLSTQLSSQLTEVDKQLKTTANENAKFGLQHGHVTSTTSDHVIGEMTAGEQNGDLIELKLAYKQQAEEMRRLKKQLARSERKVKELQDYVRKLEFKRN